MVALIVLLLLGLVFGVFAVQNTQHVTVSFFNVSIKDVPVYLVMIIPLITGLTVAWIISLVGTFSHFLAMRGKNSTINESKKNVAMLNARITELENENEELKAQINSPKTT